VPNPLWHVGFNGPLLYKLGKRVHQIRVGCNSNGS
jgi:hypothetical protein